jgi:hypothetical protein
LSQLRSTPLIFDEKRGVAWVRIEGRGFSISIPVLRNTWVEGPLRELKLRGPQGEEALRVEPPLECIFLVGSEVDGEFTAAQVWVVNDLPHPVQVRGELPFANVLWVPASELCIPASEMVRVTSPSRDVDVDRVIDFFKVAYASNVALHEFLHLFCNFESSEVEDASGDDCEEVFNAVEDFLVQLSILDMFRRGFAVRPPWIERGDLLLRGDPALPSSMHLLKVLEEVGCKLKSIEFRESPDGGLTVAFKFSGAECLRPSMLNGLLLAELVAYEDLSSSIPRRLPRGVVRFRVEAPSPKELLERYLECLSEEIARSLEGLYEGLREVGRGFLMGPRAKSLRSFYSSLLDYLSLSAKEGLAW